MVLGNSKEEWACRVKVFNVIPVIIGIALIAIGAYMHVAMPNYSNLFKYDYTSPGILLMCLGTVIFVVAFTGCMGANRGSFPLTMCYGVLLTCIFILMIAGGIAVYMLSDHIEDKAEELMLAAEKTYATDKGVELTFDLVQREAKCCGVKSYTDWTPHKLTTTYPRSCCKSMDDKLTCPENSPISRSNIYTQPCKDVVVDWVKTNVSIVGGIAIGVAFIMMIGVLFACCLVRAIRSPAGVLV